MKRVGDKALERRLGVAQEKVEALRCAEHGKGATVSIEGAGAAANLIVTACCDPFRRQAIAEIRRR